MIRLGRRIAAGTVAAALLALVACDLWVAGVRDFWDRHSLTGSVVANLLVLAVTALIVDDVVARRQRRERAVSVAVQGLIVYGQTRRACDAVRAAGEQPTPSSGAPDELRTLASMLLTASPSLFDDLVARRFMEQVDRCLVSMLRTVADRSAGRTGDDGRDRLTSEMAKVKVTVQPLLDRIPPEDRPLLEGSSQT